MKLITNSLDPAKPYRDSTTGKYLAIPDLGAPPWVIRSTSSGINLDTTCCVGVGVATGMRYVSGPINRTLDLTYSSCIAQVTKTDISVLFGTTCSIAPTQWGLIYRVTIGQFGLRMEIFVTFTGVVARGQVFFAETTERCFPMTLTNTYTAFSCTTSGGAVFNRFGKDGTVTLNIACPP